MNLGVFSAFKGIILNLGVFNEYRVISNEFKITYS